MKNTSVQFSRSVVSNSLRPHELQHTRPPCPSPTPGVHSDSLTSIESVMPSSHLILGRPLLLLPPNPPGIKVFSSESTRNCQASLLHICQGFPVSSREFNFFKSPSLCLGIFSDCQYLWSQTPVFSTSTSPFCLFGVPESREQILQEISSLFSWE